MLTALLTQEAAAALPKVVEELLSFQTDHGDTPFFSEGTLYDLIGKGDARSLLARTRALAKATGYTERTG